MNPWVSFLVVACVLADLQQVERVIVNVNGGIFTLTELERRQAAVIGQTTGTTPALAALRSDPALRERLNAVTPRILADAVDELLLLQHAQELQIAASDAQIAFVLDAFKKENGVTTDTEFRALLADAQLSEAELRRSLARQIVLRGVQEAEVFGRVQVTEASALAYYAREQASLATPATVLFRELAVTLPGAADTPGYTDGLIRFVRARDRLQAGESFDAVARELSDGPSREAGGLVGPVDLSEVPQEVRASLRELAPGATSAPIRTASGLRRPLTSRGWRSSRTARPTASARSSGCS
ncbi:MAG TPA: SurA N-terminal domain-containing protein [Vicinamibacterales bacterium]|nr:SurA N-terminal domain-containing protein [Vicinamibacterales bacterium]